MIYDSATILLIKKISSKLVKLFFLTSARKLFRRPPFISTNQVTSVSRQSTINDLTHTFATPLYNLTLSNSIAFCIMMTIMICCINTSFIILMDILWHSKKAINVYFLSLFMKFCLQGLYSSITPLGRFGPWFCRINMWFSHNINETFFSGHTTLVTTVMLYYPDAKYVMQYIPSALSSIAYMNWFIVIFCLLALRIHYVIDVYASIVTCIMLYLYFL